MKENYFATQEYKDYITDLYNHEMELEGKHTFDTIKDYYNVTQENLYELSASIARSVLKKTIDPQKKAAEKKGEISNSGYNLQMVKLLDNLNKDIALLDNTRNATNAATCLKYTKNGDVKQIIVDRDAQIASNKLIQDNLSDSTDLIHTAAVTLLYLTKKQLAEIGYIDIERYFKASKPKRKIYTFDETLSKNPICFSEYDTNIIKESFRAVRQYIQDNASTKTDVKSKYVYIQDLVSNSTPDAAETVYRRMVKFSDIAVDISECESVVDILDGLSLTKLQRDVLKCRLTNTQYGKYEIALKLGVSINSITSALREIRKKSDKYDVYELLEKQAAEKQAAKDKVEKRDIKTAQMRRKAAAAAADKKERENIISLKQAAAAAAKVAAAKAAAAEKADKQAAAAKAAAAKAAAEKQAAAKVAAAAKAAAAAKKSYVNVSIMIYGCTTAAAKAAAAKASKQANAAAAKAAAADKKATAAAVKVAAVTKAAAAAAAAKRIARRTAANAAAAVNEYNSKKK